MAPLREVFIGLFSKLVFALDLMVLADSDKDFLSATLCYELSVQIADKIIYFAETYSATGTPAFLKQARLGVPTNSPWRIISKEEEQKQKEEHLNDFCLQEFAKILKNIIVSRWIGFRSSRYKKVFPFKSSTEEIYSTLGFAIELVRGCNEQLMQASKTKVSLLEVGRLLGKLTEIPPLPSCFKVYTQSVTNKSVLEILTQAETIVKDCVFILKLAIIKSRTGSLDNSDAAFLLSKKMIQGHEAFIRRNLKHSNLLCMFGYLDFELDIDLKGLFEKVNLFEIIKLKRPVGEYVDVKYHCFFKQWIFATRLNMEIELDIDWFNEVAQSSTKNPYLRIANFLRFHYLLVDCMGSTKLFVNVIEGFAKQDDKVGALKAMPSSEKESIKSYNKMSLVYYKNPKTVIRLVKESKSVDSIIAEKSSLCQLLASLHVDSVAARPCAGFSQPGDGDEQAQEPFKRGLNFQNFITSYSPVDEDINPEGFEPTDLRAPSSQTVREALLHFFSLD